MSHEANCPKGRALIQALRQRNYFITENHSYKGRVNAKSMSFPSGSKIEGKDGGTGYL